MKLKQFNFKKVKSTNQTAIRLIKSSKNEFGLIVSEAQSKGKGQYGRKWISYKGNIFLSFFYNLEKINLPLDSLTKINCLLVKDVISKYYKKILERMGVYSSNRNLACWANGWIIQRLHQCARSPSRQDRR